MRRYTLVIVVVLGILLGSCALSKTPMAPAASSARVSATTTRCDELAGGPEELACLEQEISGGMLQLGVSLERPAPMEPMAAPADLEEKAAIKEEALAKAEPKKKRKVAEAMDEADVCEESCRVAQSICNASVKICKITERLPEQAPRCDNARLACSRAQEQVSSCGCF